MKIYKTKVDDFAGLFYNPKSEILITVSGDMNVLVVNQRFDISGLEEHEINDKKYKKFEIAAEEYFDNKDSEIAKSKFEDAFNDLYKP